MADTSLSYDDIPYLDLSYSLTHPDHLATLATLLGMRPAPVERCRVLELGCAAGFNLIPMAYGLPGSTFVGIDLSARQIEAGQAAVAELGLENITLRQMNILEVGPDLGEFDYIIAHGLYSWVARAVQEQALAICARHLAPDGVAYISYNTYPGRRMFVALHEILRYHTRDASGPGERATAALELLDTLAAMQPGQNSPYDAFLIAYSRFLREKIASAGSGAASYLLHDELEDSYEPLFFHEFVEQAERQGLQYLADAAFPTVLAANLPPDVAARLGKLAADPIELEQYMDFVRNRAFRRTLLCRAEVALNRSLRLDPIPALRVASPALPVAPVPELRAGVIERFRAPDGAVLTIDHPVTKAAMLELGRAWPCALPFGALLDAARARAGAAPEQEPRDAQILAVNLLRGFCYSMELVELHTHTPPIVMEPGARPIVSPVARFQARAGNVVTNLRHERVDLDEANRILLRHLDGAHDWAALLALLERLMAEGVLAGEHEDEGLRDRLAQKLDESLREIARQALLVG